MSWLIIWLIVCLTAGAVILAVRQARGMRVTAGGSRRREAGELASPLWTWVERCGWCFGIVSGVAALWAIAATLSSSPARTSAYDSSSAVASSDDYPLRPCAWLGCDDRDKLDLDTGDPGHGGSSDQAGQAGQAGNDGPAEIVLEEDRIHGSDMTARYVIAPATTAGAPDCVNLLAHRNYRRLEIGLDDLSQGIKICVRTNEKHVALVSIMRLVYSPLELEVAFTTWEV